MTEEPMLCLGCRQIRLLVNTLYPENPKCDYLVYPTVCLECRKYLVNRGGTEFAQKYSYRLYENWNKSFGLDLK